MDLIFVCRIQNNVPLADGFSGCSLDFTLSGILSRIRSSMAFCASNRNLISVLCSASSRELMLVEDEDETHDDIVDVELIETYVKS